MSEKTALTIRETAQEYGLHEYTIRTLVRRRAFPVIQAGNRCYITRAVFEDYLQKDGADYVSPR